MKNVRVEAEHRRERQRIRDENHELRQWLSAEATRLRLERFDLDTAPGTPYRHSASCPTCGGPR